MFLCLRYKFKYLTSCFSFKRVSSRSASVGWMITMFLYLFDATSSSISKLFPKLVGALTTIFLPASNHFKSYLYLHIKFSNVAQRLIGFTFRCIGTIMKYCRCPRLPVRFRQSYTCAPTPGTELPDGDWLPCFFQSIQVSAWLISSVIVLSSFRVRVADMICGSFVIFNRWFTRWISISSWRSCRSSFQHLLIKSQHNYNHQSEQKQELSRKAQEVYSISTWKGKGPGNKEKLPGTNRFLGVFWWRLRDSNLWPHACEACALTSWAKPP